MKVSEEFHKVAATRRDDAAIVEVDVQTKKALVLQKDQQRAQRRLGDVVALLGVAEANAFVAVNEVALAVLEEIVDEATQRRRVHRREKAGGVELSEGLVREKRCAESGCVARTIAADLLDVLLDGANAVHVDDGLLLTLRAKPLSRRACSLPGQRQMSRR